MTGQNWNLCTGVKATEEYVGVNERPLTAPVAYPSTKLGNWFAKPLFWRPQYALFISESTFLPVFAPLAPASTLAVRFPDDLAETLRAHGIPKEFIDDELAAMDDVVVCRKLDSRQVVGVLNRIRCYGEQNARTSFRVESPASRNAIGRKSPSGCFHSEYRLPDRCTSYIWFRMMRPIRRTIRNSCYRPIP